MNRYVVLIEDDDVVRSSIEMALCAISGVSVIPLATGEEAVILLSASPDEVCGVVTDVHLPGMTGFDVIRFIRAEAKWRLLPVLVMSGDADTAVAHTALEQGATAFFRKPCSPAELRLTLERLIYAQNESSDSTHGPDSRGRRPECA